MFPTLAHAIAAQARMLASSSVHAPSRTALHRTTRPTREQGTKRQGYCPLPHGSDLERRKPTLKLRWPDAILSRFAARTYRA